MRYVLAILLLTNIALADEISDGLTAIYSNSKVLTKVPVWASAMDDTSGTTLTATYGANGTCDADVTTFTAAGKLGTSLDFTDAGNDECSGLDLTTVSLPLSLCAWLNSTDNYGIFLSGSGVPYMRVNSDKLNFYSGGLGVQGTKQINDGAWHHTCATWDSDGTTNIYVDGVLDGTGVIGTTKGNTLILGCLNLACVSSHYDGALDDVRIYDSILTLDEIKLIYNAGLGTTKYNLSSSSWFDASDHRTITIDTGVSSWASKVGTATFDQATAGYQPTLTAFNNRKCLDFDGTDDGLASALLGSDFLNASAGTVIALVQFDDKAAAQNLFWDGDSGYYIRLNTNGTLGHYSNDTSADEALIGIMPNVPYIIEATYDGTNLGITVNGQALQTDASDYISLGGTARISNVGSADFNGKLCELMTFDSYISEADRYKIRRYLQEKWNLHTHTIPESIVHLMMDDTAASTSVVNAIGGAAFTANQNASVLTTTGKVNLGFNFDGADSCIATGGLSYGDFSIAFWAKPDGYGEGGAGRIVDDGIGNQNISIAGTAQFAYNDPDAAAPVYTTANGWVVGTWRHYVFTRSGTTGTWYINGAYNSSGTVGDPATYPMPINYIGNNACAGGVRTFDGVFDDMRIYDIALTPADVVWLYNGGTGRGETTH